MSLPRTAKWMLAAILLAPCLYFAGWILYGVVWVAILVIQTPSDIKFYEIRESELSFQLWRRFNDWDANRPDITLRVEDCSGNVVDERLMGFTWHERDAFVAALRVDTYGDFSVLIFGDVAHRPLLVWGPDGTRFAPTSRGGEESLEWRRQVLEMISRERQLKACIGFISVDDSVECESPRIDVVSSSLSAGRKQGSAGVNEAQ